MPLLTMKNSLVMCFLLLWLTIPMSPVAMAAGDTDLAKADWSVKAPHNVADNPPSSDEVWKFINTTWQTIRHRATRSGNLSTMFGRGSRPWSVMSLLASCAPFASSIYNSRADFPWSRSPTRTARVPVAMASASLTRDRRESSTIQAIIARQGLTLVVL